MRAGEEEGGWRSRGGAGDKEGVLRWCKRKKGSELVCHCQYIWQ